MRPVETFERPLAGQEEEEFERSFRAALGIYVAMAISSTLWIVGMLCWQWVQP